MSVAPGQATKAADNTAILPIAHVLHPFLGPGSRIKLLAFTSTSLVGLPALAAILKMLEKGSFQDP